MQRPQLAEFMKRMEQDSVAIVSSAREATRSNDTQYRYRQDSDFLYLTGFDEPEAIAVIAPSRPEHKFTLFVRPRDPEREIWDGRRAGVEGARAEYGADAAHPISEFEEKLGEILNGATNLYYRIGNGNADLDETIIRKIRGLRAMMRRGTSAPQAIIDTGTIIHEMRLFKTEEEIEFMQRAADIAAEGHIEAMKTARPGMKEYEIEALVEYVFRKKGASGPAYTSIVGGGANATILHYINNDAVLQDGDLLLIDAGAEYGGYASDITRTFPINGRFTVPQCDIYDLVLKTQMACTERVRPGTSVDELKNYSIELLTEGMVRLGLLKGDPKKLIEEEKFKQFYMHGLGHFLGLDVHDVGRYQIKDEARRLEPGMVMTVEPGLYIAADTKDIPEKYLGIGVRIEDDVLVTADGNRVLSSKAPKQVEEIEELMASSQG
ncbi:MAG: Xaa-Pro aminopeptidase [Acidobacteriota bacterium]|jgi:Xaa-Pro aminopeptidase|nr:Xaa-Pro aminopeptidase [Acidobacteriota bacterium]